VLCHRDTAIVARWSAATLVDSTPPCIVMARGVETG
jgi:hypothetical protein